MIGTCSQLLVVVFVLHGTLSGQELQLKGTLVSPNPGFHELTGALGYSVSMMPDLDGDGLEDIIIGAPEQTEGSEVPRPGRVYVLSSMGGGPLHTLRSPFEVPDGRFGHAVSAVGDMDEDGVQEVLTGAPDEGGSGLPSRSGRAYLFSGGTGALLCAIVSPNGAEDGGFGSAVGCIGDINQDGTDDVAVSAPREYHPSNPDCSGIVYLFDGTTGEVINSICAPDSVRGLDFGYSLAVINDTDSDGVCDLVVGGPRNIPASGSPSSGIAYLFSGATGQVRHVITSPAECCDARFGCSVASVNDLNGDGIEDLVVGAFLAHGEADVQYAGRAYVFSGGTGDELYSFMSPNETFRGGFGYAVSRAGDLNGDDMGDVVVSAVGEDEGTSPTCAGRVYAFSGGTGGWLRQYTSSEERYAGSFGTALGSLGDIDGDSVPDLVVGAPGEWEGCEEPGVGRGHVLSGATGELISVLRSPLDRLPGGFGSAVAFAGATETDEEERVFAGAPLEDPFGSPEDAGRGYAVDQSGEQLLDLVSPNEREFGWFGRSVAGGDDFNGDGVLDLLIGAPNESTSASSGEAGRVYVVNGETGVVLDSLWVSDDWNMQFGYSVAGGGDLNGDGVGEIVVGAPRSDPGNSPADAGRVYVCDGATREVVHVFASPSEEADGRFGFCVAGVDDLNGDDVPELVASAPYEDGSAADGNAGRVYVFCGATGENVFTLLSPYDRIDARFGWSVSRVSDIDNDGIHDIVVGAPNDDFPPIGRVYVFSGSTGEMVYVRSSPNEEEQGEFGYSVSGIEDLDGDGAGEIIVGAPGETSETGIPGAGRAYLYSGQTGSLIASIDSPDPEEEGRFGAVVVGGSEALAVAAPGEWNGAGRVYLYEHQVEAESAGGAHVGEPRLRVVGASPCFGTVIFSLVLPTSQPVRVSVFDLLARRVCTVTDKLLPAGEQRIVWTGCDEAGRDVPNGIYVCSARIGHRVISARAVIIR